MVMMKKCPTGVDCWMDEQYGCCGRCAVMCLLDGVVCVGVEGDKVCYPLSAAGLGDIFMHSIWFGQFLGRSGNQAGLDPRSDK